MTSPSPAPHILRDASKLASERVTLEIMRIDQTFGPHPEIIAAAAISAFEAALIALTISAFQATGHVSAEACLGVAFEKLLKDCPKMNEETKKFFQKQP
jgi:hypothetical protein